MESLEDQEIARLQELLRRSGEFVAYFELVESKMLEWRDNIEEKANQQQKQLHALQVELESLKEILTQAGLSKIKLVAEKTIEHGKIQLDSMQKNSSLFFEQLQILKKQITEASEKTLKNISDCGEDVIQRLDNHLSQYDVQQFARIANESCEQVEHSAKNTLTASHKMLKRFHWKTVTLAFCTALMTAFVTGLYISDEFPWEIHQHAMHERGAGKLLMSAWPKLSHNEKTKILGEQKTQKL